MSENGTKVSVIVVTHNSAQPLVECLKSLRTGTNGTKLELVNVDNSSSDNSVNIIKDYFPAAKVICNKDNVGFAAACNTAAKHSSGDYLLFLNPDVRIDQNTIENLLDVCRNTGKVGTVVGRMRFPDGSFQATCRRLPQINNVVYSRGSVLSKLFYNSDRYTLPDYDKVTPVPAAAGALMMINSQLFSEIGGFDQRFFVFMEDVDLCRRLGTMGYTNYFVPSAGGIHLWGGGSNAGKFRRNLYHHYTVWKYFKKHHPGFISLVLLPFALVANFAIVTLLPVPQPINRK